MRLLMMTNTYHPPMRGWTPLPTAPGPTASWPNWRLQRRWDKIELLLLFSLVVGEPLKLPPHLPDEVLDRFSQELQQRLQGCHRQALGLLRRPAGKSNPAR
jgi:hypothetical protein